MFIYLYVTNMDMKGKVIGGTLEIAQKKFSGDQVTQVFEWRGENGTSDGGTWEWSKDSDGFVAMMLTSNKTGTLIGELISADFWGKAPLPPIEPWFKNGSTGYFTYILPTGKELICQWRLK